MRKTKILLIGILSIVLMFILAGCLRGMNNESQKVDLKFIGQRLNIVPFGVNEYTFIINPGENAKSLTVGVEKGQVYPRQIVLGERTKETVKIYTEGKPQRVTLTVYDDKNGELVSYEWVLEINDGSKTVDYSVLNALDRNYGYILDGLYIVEDWSGGKRTNFYRMTYINEMTIEEKVAFITKIIKAAKEECWFVLANYRGYYDDFSGGLVNWPQDDAAFENLEEWVYDIQNQRQYNTKTGETQNEQYRLTAQASPVIGGAVGFSSTTFSDTISVSVDEGTQVLVYAQAAEGYTFEGWYEGETKLSEANPITITVDEDKAIKANFTEDMPTLLRDLGPEGNLQEEGNVYNILDNTAIGYWSVSIRISRLPAELQGAGGWSLFIEGNEYEFTQNLFAEDMYETNVDDSVAGAKEDVRNAIFDHSL